MAKGAFVLLSLAPLLLGCGMTSDVQSMEDGSYLIAANTTPVWNAPSDAHDIALRGAEEFCVAQKRKVIIVADSSSGQVGTTGFSGTSGGSGMFAAGTASLNFRCE